MQKGRGGWGGGGGEVARDLELAVPDDGGFAETNEVAGVWAQRDAAAGGFGACTVGRGRIEGAKG